MRIWASGPSCPPTQIFMGCPEPIQVQPQCFMNMKTWVYFFVSDSRCTYYNLVWQGTWDFTHNAIYDYDVLICTMYLSSTAILRSVLHLWNDLAMPSYPLGSPDIRQHGTKSNQIFQCAFFEKTWFPFPLSGTVDMQITIVQDRRFTIGEGKHFEYFLGDQSGHWSR